MSKIQSTYKINRNTLALMPAKHIAYDTIVLEPHQTACIRQTPLQIIQSACFNDWSTYEGRRQAVIYHTNFKHKVPIPIDLHQRICFFPTHSPRNFNNLWIAFQHIAKVSKTKKKTGKPQPIIHFKSGQTLTLDISIHTLKQQMNRTLECMYRIGQMNEKESQPY